MFFFIRRRLKQFFFRRNFLNQIRIVFVRDWSTFSILIEDFKRHFFFVLFFKFSFWSFDSISTNEMTHNSFSIFSMWKQSKAKSIAKCFNQFEFFFELTQKFIDFVRNASFFFSFLTARLFLFWDGNFKSHVAQKLVTSSSMIIDFSRNFVLFWTILHFFVFKKTDDSTQKIDKFNSKAEKTKTSKFSIDELTKTQTKKQEINTIFFSISISFFFIDKNDTNDWFSFARFSKVEKKIRNATNSKVKNWKRIKIESQNS